MYNYIGRSCPNDPSLRGFPISSKAEESFQAQHLSQNFKLSFLACNNCANPHPTKRNTQKFAAVLTR